MNCALIAPEAIGHLAGYRLGPKSKEPLRIAGVPYRRRVEAFRPSWWPSWRPSCGHQFSSLPSYDRQLSSLPSWSLSWLSSSLLSSLSSLQLSWPEPSSQLSWPEPSSLLSSLTSSLLSSLLPLVRLSLWALRSRAPKFHRPMIQCQKTSGWNVAHQRKPFGQVKW